MSRLLGGKVVLVNGGTQGVGAAVARAAVRDGARVVVTGRRLDAGRRVAADLSAEGGDVRFVQADIADPEQAKATVTRTVAEFGRIDGLCNAAGLTTRGTLLDTTPELFDQHIAVNLRGPFFAMQAAVADMVARDVAGSIVNIISVSAHAGQPYLAPYVAAKAGLIGLTRNAAHAHRWDRIRINGLNIGWTESEGEDRDAASLPRRWRGLGRRGRVLAADGQARPAGRDRGNGCAAVVPAQRGGDRLGNRLGSDRDRRIRLMGAILGVIGLGRIGAFHAQTLHRTRWRRRPRRHRRTTRRHRAGRGAVGRQGVPDAAAALSAGLDGVVIAAATPAHAPLLLAAVDAGVPVSARSRSRSPPRRAGRRCAAFGFTVPVQIGYNRRFDPAMRACYDAVRSGDSAG